MFKGRGGRSGCSGSGSVMLVGAWLVVQVVLDGVGVGAGVWGHGRTVGPGACRVERSGSGGVWARAGRVWGRLGALALVWWLIAARRRA